MISMAEQEKLTVAVLCGGFSGERQISLLSGENVMKYLDRDKYVVSRIDVVSEEEWHWYGDDEAKRILDLKREEDLAFLKSFRIFFNVLHGTYGEDGQLQDFLDGPGASYTGSGAAASALAIDKIRTMEYVTKNKILVPEFFVVEEQPESIVADRIVSSFGYPVIVKPNDSGSTLGLTLVQRPEQLAEALDKAGHITKQVIVQRYIFGREFTCGILGNSADQDLITLPPIEIIIQNQVFDFNDKYFSKETQEICPAPVDKFVTEHIKEQALLAHRVLGCDGLSRTDFRMDGAGQLYFLETNTSPGLTAGSLCPKAAAAAGIGMPQLLDRIIDLGLSRAQKAV